MSHVERQEAHGRYCAFGAYVIDVVRGVLWREGVVVHLRPKDAEILITLIESRERVVEKDEIFQRLWPGVVVEENNLARRISELRRVLGEGAGQRSFVATFPGRGYRFVAEVAELDRLPWPADAGPAHGGGRTPGQSASGTSSAGVFRGARLPLKRALGLGLLTALGAAILAGVERYAPAIEGAPPVAKQFSFGPDLQQQPAWSPDGQVLAYAAVSGGISNIWVQRGPDGRRARLTGSAAHDWQPTWSPDGGWLAFRSEREGGGIWAVRTDGTQEHLIIGRGVTPQWSPDGDWILFSSGDGRATTAWPCVVSPSGGPVRAILQDVLAGSAYKYAAWHPDGRVSVWFRDRDGVWRFVTTPVSGGPVVESSISVEVERVLTARGVPLQGLEFPFSRLERFVWSPSGRHLYFEAVTEGTRGIWRIAVDRETLEWKKGPDPMTTGIGRHAQIALSPDGRTLAFTAQADRTRVWAIPLDSSPSLPRSTGEPLTSGSDEEVYTRATADGRVLVYRSVQGSRNEFKVRDGTSAGEDRALIGGIDRNALQLSPDGLRVVYTRFGESGPTYVTGSKLVSLPLRGGEERTLFDSAQVRFAPTDWSLDGELLLGRCVAKTGGPASVCTLPARLDRVPHEAIRTVVRPRTGGGELRAAVFSPDARWIAFTETSRTDAGSSTIYVAAAEGGTWIPVAEGAFINDRARWAPDGRTLYFLSNRSGHLNVWGQSFDLVRGRPLGSLFQVTSFSDPQVYIPYRTETGISVTSSHLLVPLTELRGNIWVLAGLNP
jgi:Tol biopolymer transport system component/DNA-binding winged helix-turn-helix (wHTH) protein